METILDSAQSESKTVTYAGFWLRFVAMFIDGIIVGIVQTIITLMFFGGIFMSPETFSSSGMGAIALYYLIVISINWLYYAGMESSTRQATLGKSALGIKVTDINGERIGFGQATGRYFSKFLSALILGIGYLMAGFTEKKQALHDQVANTLVVRN